MGQRFSERHQRVIEKILEQVHQNLPREQHDSLEKFVNFYYTNVADDDLDEHNPLDLYGAVLSHWNYLAQREPGEVKLRVFNPDYEQHGWQSKHTVIELCMLDTPFIVDSLRMRLGRLGLTMHMMVNPSGLSISRDKAGTLTSFSLTEKAFNAYQDTPEKAREAVVYIEVDQQPDNSAIEHIQNELMSVLDDVVLSVRDWKQMKTQARESYESLKSSEELLDSEELAESLDFIHWFADNNFTFLGCRDYQLVGDEGEEILKAVEGSGLGLLDDAREHSPEIHLKDLSNDAREAALSNKNMLVIQQLSTVSTVHRPSPPYYVGIKKIDENGKVIGERRFIGLYTSVAYHSSPLELPFLRRKVHKILAMASMVEGDHSWRQLLNILETYPRDELFQASEEDLFLTAMGIFHLQERRRIRLFVRQDPYGRFYSCLVFVPRDQFNSELRSRIGDILREELHGNNVEFVTQFSESILARIHFTIRFKEPVPHHLPDTVSLEKKVAQSARTWSDDLIDAVREFYGEGKATVLINNYQYSFPASYRETYDARTAVHDIEHMQYLSEDTPMRMSLYRPLESIGGVLHFKLFYYQKPIALSDILPMLENMGLRVIGERTHEMHPCSGTSIWISDFSLEHSAGQAINVDKVRSSFQEAFANIWRKNAENDGFNRLVLTADLSWRETAILRAYAKYMRQIGFTFSLNYIEGTLAKYPHIAQLLIRLFELRFSPEESQEETEIDAEKQALINELESVDSLDEDKIIRRYVDLIYATLRTNFYQTTVSGEFKNYISLKMEPAGVPEMPLPKPMFEIFVYSPRVEGVHLRSAKVARGGLRWSDRREDFRTEILGLMKAQQVKNAVIVPAGAKGGFVPKDLPASGSRDEVMAEVVCCYETFISGLLDVTDNLVGTQVIPPKNTTCYDGEDYYLVVAADKGTATFSDIANKISEKYGFWLGDAFASGGSVGYDHKKMGITARGAWESVKCNFLELGVDVQQDDFTVVGIGDMAGDVFGNGMLLSKHIKLVAAFNHMHIFLDPAPDTESSFNERTRLFELPRSSWADYNPKLISSGGGIFNRSAKSIKLSSQVQELLGLSCESIVPNELIKAILKAQVDLLWNGGIGTYVKGAHERNEEVGDRANDAVRLDGSELRCRVVGEGGNLGLTQHGRVEYALNQGVSFTDFIDNSAGVDCSDHEVNIKILLNSLVDSGDMTQKQRNALLADMTDEVSTLVLKNNIDQTKAISLASFRASKTLDEYRRFIHSLERMGRLDRELECLPDEDQLAARKAAGEGLTRPELSVLLAYSKILLKEEILQSDIPEDDYFGDVLASAFPICLSSAYGESMHSHKMRREIIATQISSLITNEMGATFIKRLFDETGAPAHMVARSYLCVREIFDVEMLGDNINALDKKVDQTILMAMRVEVRRLLRRATRWFLRNRRKGFEISETVTHFKPKLKELTEKIEEHLVGIEHKQMRDVADRYIEAGVSKLLANNIASTSAMLSALDIIEASTVNQLPVTRVAEAYFALGASLQLDWFRGEITSHRVTNNWDALARAACRDDLDRQQRSITESVLSVQSDEATVEESLEVWMQQHQILVERWFYMVADLKATKAREFSMFAVALRELLDLAQASSTKFAVS